MQHASTVAILPLDFMMLFFVFNDSYRALLFPRDALSLLFGLFGTASGGLGRLPNFFLRKCGLGGTISAAKFHWTYMVTVESAEKPNFV